MTVNALPVWGMFVGTIVIVMTAIEAGYWLGRLAHRRWADEKESSTAGISTTVLGLVAFMLAFTFGIVASRFDARKTLVREEANAIRTAWLRSDILPDADRKESKKLMDQYLRARLAWVQSRDVDPQRVNGTLAEMQRMQERLWQIAVGAAGNNMSSPIMALYLESLNHVFSLHALRVTIGLQSRIPGGVWIVLLSITMLGMLGMGYQNGIGGSKKSTARPILALAFALVIVLIVGLDRPEAGLVTVSQQPLADVLTFFGPAK